MSRTRTGPRAHRRDRRIVDAARARTRGAAPTPPAVQVPRSPLPESAAAEQPPHDGAGVATSTPASSWAPIVDQEDAERFPHACAATEEDADDAAPGRSRLVGLDVARGLALVGMIAVHTISAATDDGTMTTAWVLANGKASALFAVLSGVGLAFIAGRRIPPRGTMAVRMAATVALRGLVLLLVGLALGSVVAADHAEIVLPYLGVMFVLAGLLLPLRTRSLLVIGLTWALVGPVVSHLLRQGLPAQAETGPNLGLDAIASPLDALTVLLVTGVFPAITWMSYVCIGLALGRADLRARHTAIWSIAGGLLLVAATALTSRLLVDVVGVRERLAQDVSGEMTLDTFTDLLVFGPSGSLPADSWWWLGIEAPHAGTPLDLLSTIGIALAVIGVCLALASVFRSRFALLAVPGSMTLTMYTLHVLLLGPTAGWGDLTMFTAHLVILAAFAFAWSSAFARGPLEELMGRITDLVRPRRRPTAPTGRHRTELLAGAR